MKDIKQKFLEWVVGNMEYGYLYEDVTDDGDGIFQLTGEGEGVVDFIEQELDKARKEGRRELVKEIREAIRENMNKNWDIEKRHIAIDEDIVRIINDGEITEMYTEGEEELKDGGWGWYS